MNSSLPPGKPPRLREPFYTRRVFGFFLVVGIGCFGWSLTHAPETLSTLTGAARASEAGQAYLACQQSVRKSALNPTSLRFPGEPESTEDEGDNALALASSVTVSPRLGAPYTQHFTCRAARLGRGARATWKVTRMAMDLPVS